MGIKDFYSANGSSLDLLNADGLDDSFSNFRALGVGKPSAKQIVHLEKTNPTKIDDLLAKKIITKSDVDAANKKEKYTPAVSSSTTSSDSTTDFGIETNLTSITDSGKDNSSNESQLPFTSSSSFLTYIMTIKSDYTGLTGLQSMLKQVKELSDKGLTGQDIADSINSLQQTDTPITSADADILKGIADDDKTMKAFSDLVAAAKLINVQATPKVDKKIFGMSTNVAYPVLIVGTLGLILLGSKIFGKKIA